MAKNKCDHCSIDLKDDLDDLCPECHEQENRQPRECIRCGQLALDVVVDDYESTKCEQCLNDEWTKEKKHQVWEYERGLLP